MTRAKVVRINRSFYLNVPAEEARRLNLQEGQLVEVDVKPMGKTVREAMQEVRGKYKGIKMIPDRELWGEGWG